MRNLSLAVVLVVFGGASCWSGTRASNPPPASKANVGVEQTSEPAVPPVDPTALPLDMKSPPADAAKMASGMMYKKVVTNAAGTAPKRNDTVMVIYRNWKQSTGELLNGVDRIPVPFSLATGERAFAEAIQTLKTGEKAILWVPAALSRLVSGEPEVCEFEVIDIDPAPAIPVDLKVAAPNAQALKSGAKYVVVRRGTGKDKIRHFDTATYHATAWDGDGRMFYSTEMPKQPEVGTPSFAGPPLDEVLTAMTTGERVRIWVDADKLQLGGKLLPGNPKGLVVYEVEVLNVVPGTAPPQTPGDVAKPPAGAKKTASGVFYKVLKAGKRGPKPKPTSVVKVHYTGWTTDGKLFDSSVQRGEPATFPLEGVIPGWRDGVQVMSVGDKVRFWIPEKLAYKGRDGAPKGMLVFDVELLEIVAKP